MSSYFRDISGLGHGLDSTHLNQVISIHTLSLSLSLLSRLNRNSLAQLGSLSASAVLFCSESLRRLGYKDTPQRQNTRLGCNMLSRVSRGICTWTTTVSYLGCNRCSRLQISALHEPRQRSLLESSEHTRIAGICHFAKMALCTFAPVASVAEDPVCGGGDAAFVFYHQSFT